MAEIVRDLTQLSGYRLVYTPEEIASIMGGQIRSERAAILAMDNRAVTSESAGCPCWKMPVGTCCEWLAAPEPEPAPPTGPLTLELIKAEFAKDGRLTKKQIQWLIDRVESLGKEVLIVAGKLAACYDDDTE